MLRGPALYPTTVQRWAVENGYRPPGELGVDWDPGRLPAGLKSRETYLAVAQTCRLLQRRHPGARVEEFTEAQLVEFLLESTGPSGARWAPETIAVRSGHLRTVFSWAHWAGLVPADPAVHLRRLVKVRRQGVRPHNWLQKEDVQAVLASCGSDITGQRDRVALELGFGTGLRVKEMIDLTWDQVRLSTGQLSVVGKGGKPATQPLPPGLVGLLRGWKRTYEAGLGATVLNQPVIVPTQAIGFGAQRLVLPRWGVPMGESAWRSLVRLHGRSAGWEALAPHDLRRTYAALLEGAGVPIHEISRLLRHSNVATTERYLAENPAKSARHVAGDLW